MLRANFLMSCVTSHCRRSTGNSSQAYSSPRSPDILNPFMSTKEKLLSWRAWEYAGDICVCGCGWMRADTNVEDLCSMDVFDNLLAAGGKNGRAAIFSMHSVFGCEPEKRVSTISLQHDLMDVNHGLCTYVPASSWNAILFTGRKLWGRQPGWLSIIELQVASRVDLTGIYSFK